VDELALDAWDQLNVEMDRQAKDAWKKGGKPRKKISLSIFHLKGGLFGMEDKRILM